MSFGFLVPPGLRRKHSMTAREIEFLKQESPDEWGKKNYSSYCCQRIGRIMTRPLANLIGVFDMVWRFVAVRYQPVPYIWVLVASAVVSLAVLCVACRRRSEPGATPFVVLLADFFVWTVANAFEMMGTGLPQKLSWANIQYVCYNAIPLIWLFLVLQYTGREQWLTPRRVGLLLIMPVLTVAAVWTNQWHGLIRQNVFLDSSGPFPVVGKTYGPWFWAYCIYSYSVVLAACALLVRSALQAHRLYRWQTLALLSGLAIPFTASFCFMMKLIPLGFDLAPAVFSIGGVLFALGLFHFRLFDIRPAAHHLVIESMNDGLIIVDGQNRIVGFNPAARLMAGFGQDAIGRTLDEVLPERLNPNRTASTPGGAAKGVGPSPTLVEFGKACLDIRWSPITDRRGRSCGRLLLLHDITEIRRAQRQETK